jgi:3-oxoacyl-[acyl-carrier-protein] synthase-1
MTRIAATNITSPLGLTTAENYAAVRQGKSALRELDGCLGLPGHFCVGIFPDALRAQVQLEGFSWYESLVIWSVKEALSHTDIPVSSPRTALILGTATAGIGELAETPEKDGLYLAPGLAAKKIADTLGFVSTPITVSNACISGATAQMLAQRLIAAGIYDAAVVCGADVLSSFVLAGFDSFKALSPVECRPFDMERLGLNIGECAATLVLSREVGKADDWRIVDGCLNNDAYHVSAPIPSGDGVARAIKKVLSPERKERLACVTAHGTATLFNDQMESKAIESAGLGDIPTTALKAHYGHTFGASGILEAILTMCSLDEGLVLPARGFEELGVSGKITLCRQLAQTDKKAFVKTQSAFGGCNSAVLYAKEPMAAAAHVSAQYETLKSVEIGPEGEGAAHLTRLYKECLSGDARFYKMDLFSRLAYVGTGLLAKDALAGCAPEEIGLLIYTLNGSVLADRKHLSTFSNPQEYYPSPAIFINTLPNVALGEIAVTHQIKGETTLVMLAGENQKTMDDILAATLAATRPAALIAGWVDCESENVYRASLKLYKIKES